MFRKRLKLTSGIFQFLLIFSLFNLAFLAQVDETEVWQDNEEISTTFESSDVEDSSHVSFFLHSRKQNRTLRIAYFNEPPLPFLCNAKLRFALPEIEAIPLSYDPDLQFHRGPPLSSSESFV